MAAITTAAQFLDQKTLEAIREHERARLRLEREIYKTSQLLQRLGAVAEAAAGTDPGVLIQTCRNIFKVSQEMSIAADKIELLGNQSCQQKPNS